MSSGTARQVAPPGSGATSLESGIYNLECAWQGRRRPRVGPAGAHEVEVCSIRPTSRQLPVPAGTLLADFLQDLPQIIVYETEFIEDVFQDFHDVVIVGHIASFLPCEGSGRPSNARGRWPRKPLCSIEVPPAHDVSLQILLALLCIPFRVP